MKKKKIDKILLVTIILLMIIGATVLLSASMNESKKDFGNIYGYFQNQILRGVLVGILLGFVAYRTPYKTIKKFSIPLMLASIGLLILVFVPGISAEEQSVNRWIDLRFSTFQPSELIKLTFIIYLAAWLESHSAEIRKSNFAMLFPFISFIVIIGALLIKQPDLSTLMIIVATASSMLWVAGVRFKHIVPLGAAGLLILGVLIKIAPYRFDRILAFRNPENDPLGISYQINQALIAVGSGNLWGSGITEGIQKLRFLPEPMNDSIFAVWSEETGFIGATILILLFTIFMWRGLIISRIAKDPFVKFASIGITTWIFVQAIVNMAAIVGLIPLTGIPLPFISYGSSAMIMTLVASGLLLQLSKR